MARSPSRSGRNRVPPPGSPLAKRASLPCGTRVRRGGAAWVADETSGRRLTTAEAVRVDGHDARV